MNNKSSNQTKPLDLKTTPWPRDFQLLFLCNTIAGVDNWMHDEVLALLSHHPESNNFKCGVYGLALEVKSLILAWEATENPLFIWRIFEVTRDADVTSPPLVIKYFSLCSQNLISRALGGGTVGVSGCLGFYTRGQGDAFTRYRETVERYSKLSTVMRKKVEEKKSFEDCEAEAAEEIIEISVNKACQNIKEMSVKRKNSIYDVIKEYSGQIFYDREITKITEDLVAGYSKTTSTESFFEEATEKTRHRLGRNLRNWRQDLLSRAGKLENMSKILTEENFNIKAIMRRL